MAVVKMFRQLAAAVFLTLGLFLLFYFPALYIWQSYRWLDTGQWISLPASLAFANLSELREMAQASSDPVTQKNFAVLAFVPEFQATEWMTDPKRWLGIHKLVMWSLEAFHIGFFAAVLG